MKPESKSCRLYAGCRLDRQQASSNLVPKLLGSSVLTSIITFTTRHQRFTRVRLFDSHLPGFPPDFSNNAHHEGSLPTQLVAV
ncbi:transposase [Cupriavidus lacunae]|uniref:Transposase n=1 Tax=Cupriavidus lacunae TaxID=2666307 RepID=A0A370MXM4_9BURK|nr:transposase [Cupriavidus lacunae]